MGSQSTGNQLLLELALARIARSTVAHDSPVRRNGSEDIGDWIFDESETDDSNGESLDNGVHADSVQTPSTALKKTLRLLTFAGPEGAGLNGASVRYALCASMGNPDR